MSALETSGSDSNERRFDVTLVGDMNLDLLLYGLPEDLPCERELLASEMAIRVGGSGAITAHNLAALGNKVGFITAISSDNFGSLCVEELRHAESTCPAAFPSRMHEPARPCTCSTRRCDTCSPMPVLRSNSPSTFWTSAISSNSRHFHMSSYYLQRALTPRIPQLFAKLKAAGLTISLDPNDDPAQSWDRSIVKSLQFVDVLMPNEREACLIANEPILEQAIATLRQRVLLIIKRGAKGASAYTPHSEWHASALSVSIVDAVGAGDSFVTQVFCTHGSAGGSWIAHWLLGI